LTRFFFATLHSFPIDLLSAPSFPQHWQKLNKFFLTNFLTCTLSLQKTIPCNFSWH
jgi:hypothetical protein